MTRKDKLRMLGRIATLMADRAKLPVAIAQSAVQVAEQDLMRLAAHRKQLLEDVADPLVAAQLFAQGQKLRAVQSQQSAVLAARRADLETAKAIARPAVGRQHVLEKILLQEVKARASQSRAK
ncbi:MAG: hypothetical protein AAF376_07505 [Pseudomonadota bacterium]